MFNVIIRSLLLLTLVYSASINATVKEMIDDTAVTAAVKSKLVKEKSVSASDVNVTTEKGVVKLSGNVKSHTEANKIIEIANSTKGVKEVEVSDLTVGGSEQPITDAVITSKVKGLFIKEAVFGNKPIAPYEVHVETKEGVVYLSGKIKNNAQRDTAIQLAKSVSGVEDVKSSLEVCK